MMAPFLHGDPKMAQILLTHPQHGCKFAMSDAEVEHDEKFGWVRYTDETPVAAASVEEKPKRKYTRRVNEPTLEQPNGDEPVSDESAGN